MLRSLRPATEQWRTHAFYARVHGMVWLTAHGSRQVGERARRRRSAEVELLGGLLLETTAVAADLLLVAGLGRPHGLLLDLQAMGVSDRLLISMLYG